VELFASRGLIETLRAAPENSVVPVRVVRDVERPGSTALRPFVEAPAASAATRPDVVVRFSTDALDLARRDLAPPTNESEHRPEPPPRGTRLDVVA
jgi:hypothetical protein